MSNIANQVTPLTRAILWLVGDISPAQSNYQEIDYLLDGLLTASLENSSHVSGQLIVGENFGVPLYVMIVREPKEAELVSFLQLIKKDLRTESNIVVIDEKSLFDRVKPFLKELIPYFKLV